MEDQVIEETGVEDVSAAEAQEVQEIPEDSADESGANEEVAAEPEKQNNFEKAFAKRLAEKEAQWKAEKESEIQKLREEYKDYDVSRKAMEYLMKQNGINDSMSLKEQLELVDLNERAESENVSPEVLKRIDELEAKAAKAEEYEKQQAEQKQVSEFESSLKEFAKDKQIDGKPVDHMELWQYMSENQIAKPEAALKAMKADILEAKLETAKADAVKEYLASKQAPKVEGAGVAGAEQRDTSKMGWGDITKAAAERLRASMSKE